MANGWPKPQDFEEFSARNALQLLDEVPGDVPWYLWINFPGPHDPFDPPEEIYRRYEAVDLFPPVNPDPSSDPEEVFHQRRSYAACSTPSDPDPAPEHARLADSFRKSLNFAFDPFF